MSGPEANLPAPARFDQSRRDLLNQLAWLGIDDGLERGAGLSELRAVRALRLDLEQLATWLREPAATFVTLHKNHELRGCIGTLQAHQPLAQDVVDHAFAAAFQDPRFSPLQAQERAQLSLHISVLGPSVTIDAHSEQRVLEQLRPGVHGLILSCGHRRATFLPSVWESTPTATDFLRALKHKAGLPLDGWPPGMRAAVYEVEQWSAAPTIAA